MTDYGTIVFRGTVSVNFAVVGYTMDDGTTKYDVTGVFESDELFDTVDEAIAYAQSRAY